MSPATSADDTVRPARVGDEEAIGLVQVDSWIGALGGRLGRRRHDAFDRDAIVAAWRAAIVAPPTPSHRVFVAIGDGEVCGFVAVSPPQDIVALEVDPSKRRRGHGSRLLAAAVDHLRANGSTQMRIWALADDAVRATFLSSAGFGLAGMTRELDGPGIAIPEQLWHASLD